MEDLNDVLEGKEPEVTEPETPEPQEPEPEQPEAKGEEEASPPDAEKHESQDEPEREKVEAGFKAAIAAERERRRKLEEQLRELEAKATQPTQAQPQDKPKPDDFEDEYAYFEALADWKANQAVNAYKSEAEQRRQQEEAQRQATRVQQDYQKRVDDYRAKRPDYDEVVTNNQDLPISDIMAQAIMESEAGPDIAYHLGQNPHEAFRISQMSPVAAAKEIGRLEAKVTSAFEQVVQKELQEQETSQNKLPGSLANERAATSNSQPVIDDGSLEDILGR